MSIKDEIRIRDLVKDDFSTIIDLIDQTWNYRNYGLSEIYCQRKAERDLYSSLLVSDFRKVILVNDKVVGFILADTGKNISTAEKFTYQEKIKELEQGNRKSSEGILINRYATLFRDRNSYLLKKANKDYKAELVYFVVDQNFRGIGLGKRLIKELIGYLLIKCVNSLYLFTDSTCDIEFYKRIGFVQKAETAGHADLRNETLQFYLFVLEDLSSSDLNK